MTVHKVKGLEFPVVVLADPTSNATRDTPSRHVDPHRRMWTEPLCGSAPIELLEAADEELRRDCQSALDRRSLSFRSAPSPARGIATRHSSHGGEFGERLDLVNDAEDRLRRSEHSASTHL
jgi:superfamily I DNA/RNA helicase